MEEKQFVCNDCGCRFEYRILKKGETPVTGKTEKETVKEQPRRVMCPGCDSLNVTTA